MLSRIRNLINRRTNVRVDDNKLVCPGCTKTWTVLFVQPDRECTIVCDDCGCQFDIIWHDDKVKVKVR